MMKQLLFRVFLLALVFLLLELAGALLLKRYSSGQDYENIRNYEKIRRHLLGEATAEDLPRFTAQPYLNYVMTPGFREHGTSVVNTAGYRGAEIPVKKEAGTLRILFLGGSTTFSAAVRETENTFPAVCARLLEAHLDTTATPYARVEALNGGLLWATSFELLTHYLFKYKYYNPDIVVIHAGGNDAQAYNFSSLPYTPDYSHWRKNMETIHPLPQGSRCVLRSRLMSFLIIHLFYSHAEQTLFVHRGTMQSPTWHVARDFSASLDTAMNAFYQNLNTLIREIQANNAQVALTPFIFNTHFHYNEIDSLYLNGIRAHNTWMRHIAAHSNVAFVDLKNSDIPDQSYWADDCHLTAEGEKIKAQKIAATLAPLLNGRKE